MSQSSSDASDRIDEINSSGDESPSKRSRTECQVVEEVLALSLDETRLQADITATEEAIRKILDDTKNARNDMKSIREDIAKLKIVLTEAKQCQAFAMQEQMDALRQALPTASIDVQRLFSADEPLAHIIDKLKKFIKKKEKSQSAKEERLDVKGDRVQRDELRLREERTILTALTLQLQALTERTLPFDGIEVGQGKSGLLYVRQSHRIAMGADSSGNIGLVERINDTFRHREIVERLTPCEDLEKAWLLFNDDLTNEEFIERLVRQLSELDPKLLRIAWTACQNEFPSDDIDTMKETALQQFVYPPFAGLFKAAAGVKYLYYK